MVDVLPCTISKRIPRRILVSEKTLNDVYDHVLDLHAASLDIASDKEREVLKTFAPSVEITYRDGTTYEIHDRETLRKVIPGKGKSIRSITLESIYGPLSCSVNLETWTDYSSASVRIKGPEDRASHVSDVIVSTLTRDSDITVAARRIWPFIWGVIFAGTLVLPLGLSRVADWKSLIVLFLFLLLAAFPLWILVELFRSRWLRPVAFLWGEDGRRAHQARFVVTTAVVTIPVGLLINVASALLFRS